MRDAVFLGCLIFFAAVTTGCIHTGTDSADTGNFNLLISDEEADIGDFDSLNVTVEEVRLEPANASQESFTETLDEPRTVDLTTVIGEQAREILRTTVPAGEYAKVELTVQDQFDSPGAVRKTRGLVKQSVVDSDAGAKQFVDQRDVQVMVPSGKLQIEQPFTVTPNSTVDFVFDIQVVLKGATGEYNLIPNIAGSGVEGDDVPVHDRDDESGEPDDNDTAEDAEDGDEDAGGPPEDVGQG